jgi:pyruvate dehydrogenase E1 component beta subunit
VRNESGSRSQSSVDEEPDVAEVSVFEAINNALVAEMRRDPTVVLLGEDLKSGVYGTAGLAEDELGPNRVFDTPLSEGAFFGAAVGAALVGMRPVVYSSAAFVWVAFDQIVSQAAKMRYMFGGQARLPVLFRFALGYGPTHHDARSHSLFMTVPGLKIAMATGPADAVGLLRTALRGEDPVVFFEDPKVRNSKGHVPDGDYAIPFGKGDVKQAGSDVTVVAIGGMLPLALQVAGKLATEGVSVEVVDPRTLVPLDRALILESVAKTGRLVIADPAPATCSAASEIAATVAEHGFWSLRAPIQRVTPPDVHTPFSPALVKHLHPNAAALKAAVMATFE